MSFLKFLRILQIILFTLQVCAMTVLLILLASSCSARISLTEKEKLQIHRSRHMGYWGFKPQKTEPRKLVNYTITGAMAGYSIGKQRNIKWP